LKSLNYGSAENLIAATLTKTDAVLGQVVGSAADVSGTDLTGYSFSVMEQGAAINTFTAPDAVADKAALDAALANAGNWSVGLPSEISFSSSGLDDAVIVTIDQIADANDHRNGRSQVAELIAGSGSDLLAFLSLSAGLVNPSQEPALRAIISRQVDSVSEDSDNIAGDVGGDVYLEIGCNDSSCEVSIDSSKLTSVAATAEDMDINLADFNTIDSLAEFIDSKALYSASVPAGVNGGLNPNILDRVVSAGASSPSLKPCKIKADAWSLANYFNANSGLVELERDSYIGLPDAIEKTFLSGGAKGASATSDFSAALTELEKEELDFIIPLVSQDASDDLAEDAASTDSASTYDVDSILAAVNTHCRKMSGTKARKERQCYVGYRGTFDECRAKSLAINSEFTSLLMQDILVPGAADLEWKQPFMAACLVAGMHAGAEVGQPVTRKYINCQGVRHRKKQGLTPSSLEEFDSRVSADLAIQDGILPLLQPASGGVRVMVHNATYSKDSNFAFNRPSVLYAGHYVARTMREQLEAIFIGEKNKTSTPADLVAYITAVMADFKRADIIVGDDTNDGLGYKDLAIRVQGNTIYINVVVTIVEGIDFILPTITLDRAQIST